MIVTTILVTSKLCFNLNVRDAGDTALAEHSVTVKVIVQRQHQLKKIFDTITETIRAEVKEAKFFVMKFKMQIHWTELPLW